MAVKTISGFLRKLRSANDELGALVVATDTDTGGLAIDTTTPLLVDSSDHETTATTYTAGLLTAYTERRLSDNKTRNWTITRNADGTIATATVSAWA